MAMEYEVVNGPGKQDLMLALFDQRCDKVMFRIELILVGTACRPSGSRMARILSVRRRGDYETWEIAGEFFDEDGLRLGRFEGLYMTTTRKGSISVHWWQSADPSAVLAP